jgi:DNA-binding CsgD family transcriptional regulator
MRAETRAHDRAVVDITSTLGALSTLDEFGPALLDVVQRWVPFDHATYNELNNPAQRVRFYALPPDETPDWDWRTYADFLPENPLSQHVLRTKDGSARRISDFISQDELHATGLYQHVFRPLGIEYQLGFTLPAPRPLRIGVALSRHGKDFTDDECDLVNAVRPHLIQAYRTTQLLDEYKTVIAGLASVLQGEGRAFVVVHDGRAVTTAGPAAEMLNRYFDATRSERLPEPVEAWIAAVKAHGTQASPQLNEPLARERDGRRLMLRYVNSGTDQPELIWLEERSIEPDVTALRDLGLTEREAEILHAVVQGDDVPAIAGRLHVRERTVHKHLQNVYRKLGVSSRAAATAQAIEALHWHARP